MKVALPGARVEVHFVDLRVDRVRCVVEWKNARVERVYHVA